MPLLSIPYHSLNTLGLLNIHNEMALRCGQPSLKTWRDSRCKLVQRVAILRTRKPLPPAPPKKLRGRPRKTRQPMRDAIMESLAFVSHYEDAKTGTYVSKHAAGKYRRARRALVSVGLPYSECVKRVRRRFPHYAASSGTFRVIASRVRDRETGYEKCKLPHKRPHGTKGKRK